MINFYLGFKKRASTIEYALPRIENRLHRWGQTLEDVYQKFPESKELLQKSTNLNDPNTKARFRTLIHNISKVHPK